VVAGAAGGAVGVELWLGGNKRRLIDKDSLEARLGRSPDLADAMIQSFAF
jgi:hypothetical protein